jgi:hypothetical protein
MRCLQSGTECITYDSGMKVGFERIIALSVP